MKIILKDGRRYMLRFDKDEDVISKLSEFLTSESISAASFTGVGAVSQVELGFFNPHIKDYRRKVCLEDFEIISLTGNVSVADGKPLVHAHGMFGRTDFTSLGGHIFKLIVSVTCEIFLIKLDGQIARKQSEEWNLKLLE